MITAAAEVTHSEVVEVCPDHHVFVLQIATTGKHPDDVLAHERDVLATTLHGDHRAVDVHHAALAGIGECSPFLDAAFILARVQHPFRRIGGGHEDRDAVHDPGGFGHHLVGAGVVDSRGVDEDDAGRVSFGKCVELLAEGRAEGPGSIAPETVAVLVHRFEAEHDRDAPAEVVVLAEAGVVLGTACDRIADEGDGCGDAGIAAEAGHLELLGLLEPVVPEGQLQVDEFSGSTESECLAVAGRTGVLVDDGADESGVHELAFDVFAGKLHAAGPGEASLHPRAGEDHQMLVVFLDVRCGRTEHV
jgi:hypothetical protein